jgi:hypothetical protein
VTLKLVETPEPVNRAWWNTELCRGLKMAGLAGILCMKHMLPHPIGTPWNDRDHIKW